MGANAEAAMEEVVLTDDEVVAFAIDHGTFWPGDLPTIDSKDSDALAAAAFRGHRSLLVRGLLGEDGMVQPRVTDLCSPVLGSNSYVVTFLASTSLTRAGWGVASAHFPSSDGWIFETLNPVGVHRLFRKPITYHRAFLRALLLGVLESGPTVGFETQSSTEATTLCLLGVGSESVVLATAMRHVIRVGPVELVDGAIASDSRLVPASVDEAIDAVLANRPGNSSRRTVHQLELP
jgi:hypothetical protein